MFHTVFHGAIILLFPYLFKKYSHHFPQQFLQYFPHRFSHDSLHFFHVSFHIISHYTFHDTLHITFLHNKKTLPFEAILGVSSKTCAAPPEKLHSSSTRKAGLLAQKTTRPRCQDTTSCQDNNINSACIQVSGQKHLCWSEENNP